MQALVAAGTPAVSHLRQDLAAARDPRARHHGREQPGHDRGQRVVPEEARQGGHLRRRALLRRLPRRPRVRARAPCAPPPRRAPTGWPCATPTAAACPASSPRPSRELRKVTKTAIGIHRHNDGDMAVANSLAAVEAGATMVQGTLNGWGERCGNANLISVIPALQLKMGHTCVPEANLKRLTELSRTASELANIRPRAHAPYVGASAFAHKGGAHVAAVEKVAGLLRARAARGGGQPAQGRGLRAVRPGQRAHGGAGPGHGRARLRAGAARPREGDGEPGLPVRGGRGLVRADGPPQRSPATPSPSRCWTSSSSPSADAAARCSSRPR